MREAVARRSSSIMMNISIKLWLVGGQVDWTRKTSSPRTFSSMFTNVSPSGKELTVHWPRSRPMDLAIARARGGLDVPAKIFPILYSLWDEPRPHRNGGLCIRKRVQDCNNESRWGKRIFV